MTAEVAVMNAQAVALAADSAVTLDPSHKSFSSADKIFGLSSWEPLAAMVYGNAAFMGVPWETVLKGYRVALGSRSFPSVNAYATDFTQYLENNYDLFPKEARARQVRREVRSRLLLIRDRMELVLNLALQERPYVSDEWVEMAVAEQVNAFYEIWRRAVPIRGLSRDAGLALVKKHDDAMRLIQAHVFQGLPLSKGCKSQLDQLRPWFLTRFSLEPEAQVGHASAVVFAGFGKNEYYPAVAEIHLDGIIGNTLRYRIGRTHAVGRGNPAAVIPFGQSDMVVTFMEGIDPEVRNNLEREMSDLWRGYPEVLLKAVPGLSAQQRADILEKLGPITDAGVERQMTALKKWRERSYVKPYLFVIQSLPKDELATVAESLVSLTSLKRRVSMDYTVGGPIDVCVISKHDGCVWVKKKHYFTADLNPHFFMRYRHFPKGEQTNEEVPKSERDRDWDTPAPTGAAPSQEDIVSLPERDPEPLLPDPGHRAGRTRRPKREGTPLDRERHAPLANRGDEEVTLSSRTEKVPEKYVDFEGE